MRNPLIHVDRRQGCLHARVHQGFERLAFRRVRRSNDSELTFRPALIAIVFLRNADPARPSRFSRSLTFHRTRLHQFALRDRVCGRVRVCICIHISCHYRPSSARTRFYHAKPRENWTDSGFQLLIETVNRLPRNWGYWVKNALPTLDGLDSMTE